MGKKCDSCAFNFGMYIARCINCKHYFDNEVDFEDLFRVYIFKQRDTTDTKPKNRKECRHGRAIF